MGKRRERIPVRAMRRTSKKIIVLLKILIDYGSVFLAIKILKSLSALISSFTSLAKQHLNKEKENKLTRHLRLAFTLYIHPDSNLQLITKTLIIHFFSF